MLEIVPGVVSSNIVTLHACQSCPQIEEIGPGSGPNDGRRDSHSRESSALCHCVEMVAENGSETMSCRYLFGPSHKAVS